MIFSIKRHWVFHLLIVYRAAAAFIRLVSPRAAAKWLSSFPSTEPMRWFKDEEGEVEGRPWFWDFSVTRLLFARPARFAFFCIAYFSLCRSRHRTHFVADPLSPNAAHWRKFLHPLHHLISTPFSTKTHTVTSHAVHNPLFWRGIMCDVPSSLLTAARPFSIKLDAEQMRSLPHMTQRFLPPTALEPPDTSPDPRLRDFDK